MSLDEIQATSSVTIVNRDYLMESLTNEEIAKTLANALSIESFALHTGVEPEGLSLQLYNQWIKRLGRLPYSLELNTFVYEELPEFDVEDFIESIGEKDLETILVILTKKINDKHVEEAVCEYIENRVLKFMEDLGAEDKWEIYQQISHILFMKYGRKVNVLKSLIAHLLNKAINNSFSLL